MLLSSIYTGGCEVGEMQLTHHMLVIRHIREKSGAMDQRLVFGQNQVKGETFPMNGKGH